MQQVNPFIVDGPVPADSPLYIERQADRHLLKSIMDGEIVHLVGSPGTGKTSLIRRTVQRLDLKIVQPVVVNLSDIDTAETEEEWYADFIELLSIRMQLNIEARRWFATEKRKDLAKTLEVFLAEMLLSQTSRTVLFLDNCELLEQKGFSQALFRFLVSFNETRWDYPDPQKISFVMASTRPLGDEHISLRRFVRSLQLTDFTLEEISRLGEGLPVGSAVRTPIMRVIFDWTEGHPYLTQRTFWNVFNAGLAHSTLLVESLIRAYFLNSNITDSNLDFIRRALSAQGVLKAYQFLLLGSSIVNRGALEYFAQIGLITDLSKPQIRNRIYREVFNEKWVESRLREIAEREDVFSDRDLSLIPGGFTVANRYLLKRLLGRGPAGNVYLAEDQRLNRNVAVRIIPANFLLSESHSQEETVRHFEQCLRDAARLRHPNIIDVFDHGVVLNEKYFYLIMEYAPGEDLSRFLNRSGPPRSEQTLGILTQIVDAVAEAHDKGVLHGDLNFFKIFVISQPGANNNDLIVKVGDFGIAKLMNEAPGLPTTQPPRPGQVGLPVNLAPEQIIPGGTPWDERADIYALGLIAYQLFGGVLPHFQNLSDVLKSKQEKDFTPPPNVSTRIERAILWALEPEPNDRPASVREWFDVIETAIREESGGHFPDESAPGQVPDFKTPDDFALRIVPIILTSPLAFDREETFKVEAVVERATEEVYGQISIAPEIDNLPGAVFVGAIRQAMGSRNFQETYYRARSESLKTFIYLKREATRVVIPMDPDTLSYNEFEELKKEMLADGVARIFDTPDDFEEVFYNDLADWLNVEFLPRAVTHARQSSSAGVVTALLENIRSPDELDQQSLDELRRRQAELTGNYWFYFSCAEEDLGDQDIQQFFNRLNGEVRELAGVNQFYVGALRMTDTVARTALRAEWFPETVAALQNSRVLVPIYTPNYFKSEACGKIWEFFQLRANAAVQREPPVPSPIVLPVLWTPNESLPHPLPDTAAGIQYSYDDTTLARFSVRGVRILKKRHHEQYESFVRRFARRIVEISRSHNFPALAEPPPYSQIQNAFAPAAAETPEPAATDAYQPPRAGRSILVASSASGEITDEIHTPGIELGTEMARRGYGLMLYGRTNVDYYVRTAFDEQPVEETVVKGRSKSVHPTDAPYIMSSSASFLLGQELSEIVELVKQSDAVILIGGRAGPYNFYGIAEEYNKPVFVFEEFSQSLERPLYTRQLVRKLLDDIDRLWLSLAKPRTPDEALKSIALVHGDLLLQAAGAIVNFVGLNPTSVGAVGNELVRRLDKRLIERLGSRLVSQGPLVTAETLVTRVDQHLSATYAIHACSDPQQGIQTIESSSQALRGALRKAELLGLETIAFPSIGTGGGQMTAKTVAPVALRTVLDHLTEGSHLQTVLFVFRDEDIDAYYEAFLSLGGIPGYRVLSLSFSEPVHDALRLAEAARVQLERKHINSSLLLWALYKVHNGATRELLEACKPPNGIDRAFEARLGITDEAALAQVEPVPLEALPFLRFSSNADEAFVKANELHNGFISERYLLAGLLSVFKAGSTRWLSLLLRIAAADLFDIVADESKSISSEIASRKEPATGIDTTAWTLSLSSPQVNGQNLNNVRVGERFALTLSLKSVAPIPGVEPPQDLLRIPVNSMELTGWIRAPGFQLQLELPFSIKLIEGVPEPRSFSFELKPLLSGPRSIEVEIYPGGRVSNLGPTLITRPLTVAPPDVLPDIKELIDRRQIPHPQPDVMLYVALEETPNGQQTRMYLTCAVLDLDREIFDPLPLNENDIAELTANVLEAAARANGASPANTLAAVQAVGASLFERLIQGRFRKHFLDIRDLAGLTDRKWSWLIISDEKAILPWELVNYYGFDQQTGEIRYDDFLADQFQICHWVGQHGLRLMNSAPMGELDLVHYDQHPELLKGWQFALGPELVTTESDTAQMSLLKEGSFCFGLHLLRYTEQQRANQIVAVQNEPMDERTEGEAITGDQKLDLTLRRPTVGLSLVCEDTAPTPGQNWCNTELESNWLIPFMHAGASAVYGPRWPVSAEADQTFVQEFYDTMRQGETLGVAFSKARARVRTSFPHRTDWLAYSYFGHPHAEPYWVQPAQGFTLFEAVNQPEGEIFRRGQRYRFRASYRSEAPAWYEGRLHVQEHDISTEDMSVMVMPLSEVKPTFYKLERVAQSNELQQTFWLQMPDQGNTLPVVVRFQKQTQELRTLFLNLQMEEEG